MKGGSDMAGKIFYRDRLKVGEGEKKPRYMIVAVAGLDMQLYGVHLRKKELEQIAASLSAELIELEHNVKDGDKDND
jgi:hypothetical protein